MLNLNEEKSIDLKYSSLNFFSSLKEETVLE